jgi:hypothetical protein
MTSCTVRLRKKNIANIAAGAIIITAKAVARFFERRIRKGSSGCSTRDSSSMKTPSSATPTRRLVSVHWSPQP